MGDAKVDWQNLSKEECVKKLETNQSKGLSTSQVKKDWSNMEQMN